MLHVQTAFACSVTRWMSSDVEFMRWQVLHYESHLNNVTAVGFQCDGKWMYSGSEDGTVKIWDLRYGCFPGGRGALVIFRLLLL